MLSPDVDIPLFAQSQQDAQDSVEEIFAQHGNLEEPLCVGLPGVGEPSRETTLSRARRRANAGFPPVRFASCVLLGFMLPSVEFCIRKVVLMMK